MSLDWDDEDTGAPWVVYLLGLVDSHDQPCACAECVEAAALLAHEGVVRPARGSAPVTR